MTSCAGWYLSWGLVTLALAYIFYPIASVPSFVGGISLLYSVYNWRKISLTKELLVASLFTVLMLISVLANREMMLAENIGAWVKVFKLFCFFKIKFCNYRY